MKAWKTFLLMTLGISLIYLPVAAQEGPSQALPGPDLKSETLAFNLSLWGTLIPLAAGLLGFQAAFLGCLIGPSLGYFYAGLPGRALLGMGLRTVAGIVTLAGLKAAAVGFAYLFFFRVEKAEELGTPGALIALGGLVLIAGSAVVDIAGVKRSVRERNNRLQGKRLSWSPFVLPASKTVGIQVQLSF